MHHDALIAALAKVGFLFLLLLVLVIVLVRALMTWEPDPPNEYQNSFFVVLHSPATGCAPEVPSAWVAAMSHKSKKTFIKPSGGRVSALDLHLRTSSKVPRHQSAALQPVSSEAWPEETYRDHFPAVKASYPPFFITPDVIPSHVMVSHKL